MERNFNIGDQCTVRAISEDGYVFTGWYEDGVQVSTNNIYSFTVEGDRTLVAHFDEPAIQYTITVTNDSLKGTVNGNNSPYESGDTCTLTVVPESDYDFVSWNVGGTVITSDNPYTFTVTDNRTLTTVYRKKIYTITTVSSPNIGGTVTGGGSYESGTSINLGVTPASHFSFVQWSDGDTSNPRAITVNGNATYTAEFERSEYVITVQPHPSAGGIVTGGGTYSPNSTTTITATANTGYVFVQWSDGDTNASRTITVTEDATYTAEFELDVTMYTINTAVSPLNSGDVTGGGSYADGTRVSLRAVPKEGYSFSKWTNSSSQEFNTNPLEFQITGNDTYTAHFTLNSYTVNATVNDTTGEERHITINGVSEYSDTFNFGDTCTLTLSNSTDFTGWYEDVEGTMTLISTDSPYIFEVKRNISLVAQFTI